MSESEDCVGNAAAYVLGALEPHEAAAFELHLERCAVCREEIDSLSGVVRALPMSTPQLRAPRRLRRRVRRAVRHGSPSLDRPHRRSPRPSWTWSPSLPSLGRAPAALAGSLLALAAAAVVVISAGSGPGGTLLQARVTGGIAGAAQLRVVNGHAELVLRHLTAPGKGRIYEVWLKHGSAEPVPASVLFTVNASGDADVGLPDDMRGVSAVMVTSEPLGGTLKPTRSPVIVANLD